MTDFLDFLVDLWGEEEFGKGEGAEQGNRN